MKRYDRDYFARWYGGPAAVVDREAIRRRARLALGAAEYLLDREVRRVLDVGCGEGRWRAELVRMRPALSYTGVDGSEYVVGRYGTRRGIRRGTVGTLDGLGLRGRFDLIVCSDVLHYVPTDELRIGLAAMRRLADGVLWLDLRAAEDRFDGDREGWQPRSARTYRRLFAEAGLVPAGLGCWLPRRRAGVLGALEGAP